MIHELANRDSLRTVSGAECPAAIHKRHRWTLALIYHAQMAGLVDTPCKLISFDSHADSLDLNCPKLVDTMLEDGVGKNAIIDLCEQGLSTNNDNWILAAMRLGLVSDAIVFGFHRSGIRSIPIEDSVGGEHRFWTCYMPGHELRYEGVLGDHFKRDELGAQPLWDILNWSNDGGRFGFRPSDSKLFVSIDLDCFRIKWKEYEFPWPVEVYETEFNICDSRCGWSGGAFCESLLSRAGFVDFVEEPECCGGVEKSKAIFGDLNRFVFGSRLRIGSGTE